MSDLRELQLTLLERRVSYACYLLGLTRGQVAELSKQRRELLAGVLGDFLKAIEAADQAGAP